MKKLILLSCALLSSVIACNSNKEQKNYSTLLADSNKVLIESYFQHFNSHDWKAMADLYTDTAEMKDPSIGVENVKMTKADIMSKYSELEQMIPDVKDSIVNIYSSENNVVVEFISTGTAPDGSKFKLPICTVFEITNGKITKDLTYYDN